MRCGSAGRQLPFNEMFDVVQGQHLETTLPGKGFFHDQLEEYFEGLMQMSLYHTSFCDCNTSFVSVFLAINWELIMLRQWCKSMKLATAHFSLDEELHKKQNAVQRDSLSE